jgi:hypothetical protein
MGYGTGSYPRKGKKKKGMTKTAKPMKMKKRKRY